MGLISWVNLKRTGLIEYYNNKFQVVSCCFQKLKCLPQKITIIFLRWRLWTPRIWIADLQTSYRGFWSQRLNSSSFIPFGHAHACETLKKGYDFKGQFCSSPGKPWLTVWQTLDLIKKIVWDIFVTWKCRACQLSNIAIKHTPDPFPKSTSAQDLKKLIQYHNPVCIHIARWMFTFLIRK